MKNFITTDLPGVMLVENFSASDERGLFVKTFHAAALETWGLKCSFRESYYSKSLQNVIRGMHFQVPPHAHEKLVYVTSGEILDVILDLRREEETYGKWIALPLKEYGASVFIPKGCAHGFLALSDSATVVYNVTTEYYPQADQGIHWNSFGFDWPVTAPVLSARDQGFVLFDQFQSPF
jgi:dTDP-4-dehydrorhamnose 3,5-epimerase